jgi:hypothetical protein
VSEADLTQLFEGHNDRIERQWLIKDVERGAKRPLGCVQFRTVTDAMSAFKVPSPPPSHTHPPAPVPPRPHNRTPTPTPTPTLTLTLPLTPSLSHRILLSPSHLHSILLSLPTRPRTHLLVSALARCSLCRGVATRLAIIALIRPVSCELRPVRRSPVVHSRTSSPPHC